MDSPAAASETADARATPSAGQSTVPETQRTPKLEDNTDQPEQASPITDKDDGAEQPQKPSAGPMQKRRRVTRACDECRRKKIKCDGKQPCTHCTVYSYECTYDQPSNRRRNAAPQYIESLETQLKRAKALLSIVFPSLDLNDPSIDAHLQNGLLPQLPMRAPRAQPNVRETPIPTPAPEQDIQDSHLESMVKATGQLDLDEEGNWDYHGHSSGLSFMRRVQQQFEDIIPPPGPGSSPFVKYRPMSQVFDSPISAHQSPVDLNNVLPAGTDLPTKKEARILCDNAFIDAGAMMRVVHLPSFYRSMDRIYETASENYSNEENSFLPLLYSVLAYGTLFRNDSSSDEGGYEACIDDGFKYFRASRQLLDIADCRDLTALQAIVFMIQFLQSSAKLSTCYAYIGVAMRSALRMGMHRSFNVNFTPIEAETRKRLFWTIRRMDIYVGALLGLPIFLKDSDVDQDWPTEVDDEYITEVEIRPMPEGKISVLAASNAHSRLVLILEKICRYVYPIKGTQTGGNNSVTYSVGYSKIREIEQDLQLWLDQLPMALKPGGEAPHIIIRVQQLLRMAFGHAQLLLYRPFLHYVSQSYKNKPVDQRAFACASACISVSRNIIHITAEMKRRGLLTGAYWFAMYTTFFAIISVLYFVLENPSSPTSHELFREALQGKEVLAHFAKTSMAADRCTATLNSIFDKLPEKVKQVMQGAPFGGTKKRRQESSPQLPQQRPGFHKQNEFVATGLRRASTFPEAMPDTKSTAGQSLPISQAHLASLGIDTNFGRSPSQQGSEFFESVPSLTPTSTTSMGGYGLAPNPTPQQRAGLSFPATPLTNTFLDSSGLNVPLSDFNAMMFPSADPFAYPNQPMTTYENSHPQEFKPETSPAVANLPYQVSGLDMKQHPAPFSPVGMGVPLGPRRPTDSDVQLFGPMPMYLMHGAQQQGQRGYPPRPAPSNLHMVNNADANPMSFDDLIGGEEWANTFMDQGLGLSGPGNSFSGPSTFGPAGGPSAQNWR